METGRGVRGALVVAIFAAAVPAAAQITVDLQVLHTFDDAGAMPRRLRCSRPGVWYILRSSTGYASYIAYAWGLSGDTPAPGDFDGDAITDLAVYRPATGEWFILKSSTDYASYVSYPWGLSGDIPILKRP